MAQRGRKKPPSTPPEAGAALPCALRSAARLRCLSRSASLKYPSLLPLRRIVAYYHSRGCLVGDRAQHLRPALVVAKALAHADDHEVLVGGHVDVLAQVAAGQEAAALRFYDVHPPEVLVEVSGVGGGVHPGRLLDPARRHHLLE